MKTLLLEGLALLVATVLVAAAPSYGGRRGWRKRPVPLMIKGAGAVLDKHLKKLTAIMHPSTGTALVDTPAASFVDSEEVVNGDEADAFDDMGLAGDDAFEEDEAVHSGKATLGYDGHSHGNAHESSHGHSHSHSTSQSHGYPHGHSHGSHSHHHHPHHRHHKPKETTKPSSYSSSAGQNGKTALVDSDEVLYDEIQALYGQEATGDASAVATVSSDGFIPSRGQRLQRRRGGSHGHFHSIARHSTEHKKQDGVAHLPANLTAVGQNGKRALVDSDEVIYEEALNEQDLGDDAVDDDAIVEPSTMGTETLAGASLHHDGRRHHWHRTTGRPGKKSFAQVMNMIGAKIASSQVGPSAFADAEASMDGHSDELIGGGRLESNDFADSEFGDDGLDEEEESARPA
ncbi:hypothetical protein DFJ73DRAFT_929372 [Zopfochytrium polystomum]|nr:hypothetical protein DFJ73DRAFT_929372 [Zopfochytrium polystomum]